jgi:hypothetical protein
MHVMEKRGFAQCVSFSGLVTCRLCLLFRSARILCG